VFVKFFGKKKPESTNLRRRFHHLQLEKRKKTPAPKNYENRFPGRKKSKPSWTSNIKRFSIITVGAGIVVSSIYIIFFSSYLTVSEVTVEANKTNIPLTSLSPFLNRLKGRNILFLRTEALTLDIEKQFKQEILLARVKKKLPRTVSLVIEEHPLVLNMHIIIGNETKDLIVNKIGYAIPREEPDSLLPTLVVRNPKNPDTYKTNSYVIDQELLNKTTEAFTMFYQLFDIGIDSGEWIERARELHLKTSNGFIVYIDLQQNIEAQLSKLKRALVKLDIYKDPLEYIDLRIAGGESEKVIFKRGK